MACRSYTGYQRTNRRTAHCETWRHEVHDSSQHEYSPMGVSRSTAAFDSCSARLDEALRRTLDRACTLTSALSWHSRVSYCPVSFRTEHGRRSGYSFRSRFRIWRLVVSSDLDRCDWYLSSASSRRSWVRARGIPSGGAVHRRDQGAGLDLACSVILVLGGINLLALGVVAEYVGVAVRMAMGKPLYMIVSAPASHPLGRRDTPIVGGNELGSSSHV